MPTLDSAFFNGGGDISLSIRERLRVRGLGDELSQKLTSLGWEGQLVAGIALTTSPDGRNIVKGAFWMQGLLMDSTTSIPAAKLWEGPGKDVMLNLTTLDGHDFLFSDGSLCSDYLSCEFLTFNFSKNGQPIPPAHWETEQVGQFSLRLVAHLDKEANNNPEGGPILKYTVMAFPNSIAELEELGVLALAVGWPGIKILEGNCHFCPKSQNNSWGAPLYPLIVSDRAEISAAFFPSGEHMRFAIAEIMRTAALPSASVTKATVDKRRDDIEEADVPPPLKKPIITWPVLSRPAAERGMIRNALQRI